jgi:hypothetical protein
MLAWVCRKPCRGPVPIRRAAAAITEGGGTQVSRSPANHPLDLFQRHLALSRKEQVYCRFGVLGNI